MNAALNTGAHPWGAEETNSLQTLRPGKTKPARVLFKDTDWWSCGQRCQATNK